MRLDRYRFRSTWSGTLVAEEPLPAGFGLGVGGIALPQPPPPYAPWISGEVFVKHMTFEELERWFAAGHGPPRIRLQDGRTSSEAKAATPEQLRTQKEVEARNAQQPPWWRHQVYESVTGLRWVCCSNLITEEHSPWCQRLPERDPFPE